MAVNLKGRSFLSLADFTPEELRYLLDLGHDLKAKRRAGVCAPTIQGKHIVLLFEKTSTRTRCSFEVAATQEGAHVTYLDANPSQMGKKESLEDSAKVLGRFFDGIEYRGYAQENVELLAKYSGVPVFNGLTDVALTKLDVLSAFDTIKVCVAYDVDGERYTSVPEHQVRFEHAKPIYEELPGWKCDITGCRSFDELPQEAQDYVAFIEDLAHTRVTFIGVGAGREQIINRFWK